MERDTPQRRAVREALDRADRPLSPQDILRGAKAHAPRIGVATVYRAVKAGVEQGWLQPVELPGEPVHYELAGKAHHHHFACRSCGGVFEVEGCPGNLRDLAPDGFKLERHEVVLYGLCQGCNA